ncbi:MAG TPA: FGGY family carbohydrate kinase [Acidobacteriota bacterium]|nr:FGGY family carbohydrate kinase [Acidobacteriota bacterium]
MAREGYLGLDLGGTGAKAGVFDLDGTPLAITHRPYPTEISEDGRAELNLEDIDQSAREAVLEAVARSEALVVAMCVSSQGQTFVTLDEEDRPLHKVIAWFDSRATVEAQEMRDNLDETTRAGLDLGAIASAPKIIWLARHQPEVMRRASRFLLLPDYITYRLTGRAICDPVIARTTGLYSQLEGDYSDSALCLAGISRRQISDVAPAGTLAGKVLPGIAEQWGLQAGTPVAVGTNDQLAGALGAGNARPGIVSETTGTCLALITLALPPLPAMPAGLLQGPFPIPEFSFVLAYSKTAGLLLEWFRAQLTGGESLSALDASAQSIPPGSLGLSVLPHFDGMISPRPHPLSRGAFVNLTLQHTRAHIYRAILESLAFSLRENLELIEETGFPVESIRSIGGGSHSDVWLQIKADVTGREIERPVVTEAAVLGSAMLAARCAGRFGSIREASARLYRTHKVFSPQPANHQRYQEPYQRYLEYQRLLYPCPASEGR